MLKLAISNGAPILQDFLKVKSVEQFFKRSIIILFVCAIVKRKMLVFWWQVCTQRYGVGLLVAGLDESRAHLYYNCPSGNNFRVLGFCHWIAVTSCKDILGTEV